MNLAPLLLIPALLASGGSAPSTASTAPSSDECPGYQPALDGEIQLEAALAEARATGRRVLVVLGDNTCPWCRALCELWWRPDVSAASEAGFVVAKVDVGHGERNSPLQRRLRISQLAIPYIVVVDANEKILHAQSSSGWEEPGGRVALVPELVLDFLKAWTGPPAPPAAR